MTESITDADIALLPAEYAWIGDRLKLTMNWSETSPNILLRLFIASQKRVAELEGAWNRREYHPDDQNLPTHKELQERVAELEAEIRNLQHDITRAYEIIKSELPENAGHD